MVAIYLAAIAAPFCAVLLNIDSFTLLFVLIVGVSLLSWLLAMSLLSREGRAHGIGASTLVHAAIGYVVGFFSLYAVHPD